MNRYIIFLLLGLTFNACDSGKKSTEEVNKIILVETGISLPNYQLITLESNSAIGDYSESFTLKIDKASFKNLLTKVEKLDWQKYESGWKYEKAKSPNAFVYIYLNERKNTLSYSYVEE